MHGRLIACVAAALVALLAFTTTAAEAAQNGRIAFATSDASIATAEADGSRARTAFDRVGGPWETLRLTDPAHSPDGRKLAFTGTFGCDGCSLETTRIGVIDADGHEGQPLIVATSGTLTGLGNPTWSADGDRIGFEALAPGDGFGIYTVPATGGTPTKIEIPQPNPQDPAFSPDGRLLAFSAEDGNHDRRIFVKNLGSGEITQLTSAGHQQDYPTFSPDSQSLAYNHIPFAPGGGLGYRELATRPLTGGGQEILWSNQVEYSRWVTNRPSFSPDGRHVVFSVTSGDDQQCEAGDIMVVNTSGPANPRSIACGGTTLLGNVSWGARAALGATKLVSAPPGSTREGGDGDSDPAFVTGDGEHAVFVSQASNLDDEVDDRRGFDDVFVRDLATNRTEMLSVTEDLRAIGGDSDMPVATPDGEWVAFRSAGPALAGFEGGDTAVWLRHVSSQSTVLVSRNWRRAKVGALGDNRPLAITPDGRYVLFSSTGNELDDDQGEPYEDRDVDLFRWDRVTNTTAIVTAKAGDPTKTGNGEAGAAYMSADGNTVAFESEATDLVAGFVDRNGEDANVFVRDIAANTTTLVDGRLASLTDGVEAKSQLQGLSADGQVVLFQTAATDVVPGFADGNDDAADLYTRHVPTRRSFLITGANGSHHQGADGRGGLLNRDAVLSADGRHVFFNSDATNLSTQVTLPGNWWQVWTRALNEHGDPAPYPELLTRGSDGHGGDDASAIVDATADGGFALITSTATDLSGPLTHHKPWATLYRVDLATFEAEPVSVNGGDANNAQPYARRGAISADGNAIVYPTRATNLIDGFIDGNTELYSDVFAWQHRSVADRDVIAPTVTITTPADDAIYRQGTQVIADYACADEAALKRCDGPVPSGQPIDTSQTGEFTFEVTATDEAGNTTSEQYRYRVAAANRKLKLASGNGTAGAARDSHSPALSADGRYLVYADGGIRRRDLTTGETELLAAAGEAPAVSPDGRHVLFTTDDALRLDGKPLAPAAHSYAFSADGSTVVFVSDRALVGHDDNGAEDIYVYDRAADKLTLVSVDHTGTKAADGTNRFPVISADGTRVAWTAWSQNLVEPHLEGYWAHTYWRDLKAGVTKLVDRRWNADGPSTRPSNDMVGPQLSADGRIVLFGTDAEDIVEGYTLDVNAPDIDQVYVRDMTSNAPATLVSSAHDNPRAGTGANLDAAHLSADGTLVTWESTALNVIPDFVDHNDTLAWVPETDLYVRRAGGPARLAAHGPDGPNHGLTFKVQVEQLSADDRFAVVRIPTRLCDCERYEDDVQRLDLERGRFTNVAAAANRPIESVTASADTKRIAFATQADNLIEDFQDNNDFNGHDVFAWYDAPPVAQVAPSVTGSLKLRFDAGASTDADGEIHHFSWAFGDGGTAEGEVVEHTFPEEDTYEVELTIEDDGGNEVTHAFEIVAIKGVLTTGGAPIDFIGIDKHLRCSVVRGGPLLANGGGACGTFVALGGKTYGPPELIDGTTDYTAVSQERTEAGDVAKLVTVVALGDTGAQLRQTDTYTAGKAWYRTDVELLGATGPATVYRAARCAIGAEAGRRSLHDQGTSTAGCDGVLGGDRTLAAWLPLTAGARRDAGPAPAVFGRIAAGAPLADTCACGAQADPGAAIGWSLTAPGTVSSVAAFGPDGVIPMTLDIAADQAEVQPLDENAFTVTLRNPNAGERAVDTLAVDNAAAWDHTPGSTTGMTTADPVAGAWRDLKVAGHGAGVLRFGVQHRSGERTATTVATASGEVIALREGATVVARSVAGAKPNTAITSGPAGLTTDRDPAFTLEASKAGVHYECRFGAAAWAPCEGNPHRPGPLADGAYVLEARAVDAVGADETPARRAFVVDTAAPNTSLTAGPKAVSADNRPVFSFASNEAGVRFECHLGRGWFACEAPSYRAPALADGTYTFAVRAVDAAGNVDATPATLEFTIDTAPPVTVIDGVTGKVVAAPRPATGATAGGGAGSTVALGADGSAGVHVACPADGPACHGAVGLATQGASAAQARPTVPAGTITLARAEFSAQPGQTVAVKLPLTKTVVNTVERVGRMAVFTTVDTGDGRPVRGADVVLTPDPRTARLLDAGRELRVKRGKVKLRLACSGPCRGTIKVAGNKAVKFERRGTVSVPIKRSTKRGKELAVTLKTRLAPTKRLTLTLRAQEARR